ncbi:MAG: GIY-YIG nuclease family protein [Filimonas sp.]|nr:GIY-YIG nuclease family protein [Filimonas sp.]
MYGSWVRVPAGSQKPVITDRLSYFIPVTYILYSPKLNKYYIGACTDMLRRLYEHNIGHSKFTKTEIYINTF